MKSKTINKKVILCILDGWGIAPKSRSNAITSSKKKNYDYLLSRFPNTILNASEIDVGLPKGQFGNSEVGHMNIGSGRAIKQDILRIYDAIDNGYLKDNQELKDLKKKSKRIHVIGLLSPGGVHGHEDHLFALIDLLANTSKDIFIHCILDGRDSSPKSGINSMRKLKEKIYNKPNVKIGTISGRYYALDRDNRWERIELAYRAIVEGKSRNFFLDPIEAIEKSYNNSLTDEFFIPVKIGNYNYIQDDDGLLITNFRADRVREILTSMFDENFMHFKRKKINFSKSLGLIEYSRKINKYMDSLFKPVLVKNTLGEVLSEKKIKQMRMAETEKYAHVTYFFNGGNEKQFEYEDRILIASPRVNTYDQKPEMSAFELTEKIQAQIKKNKYDFLLINYANPDMVGHTGVFSATIRAIETVDSCLGQLYKVAKNNGYILIVTSDHGNADCMIENSGIPCTTHTTSPVPFIICTNDKIKLKKGCLADIAPSILDIMDIDKPCEMKGKTLIEKK